MIVIRRSASYNPSLDTFEKSVSFSRCFDFINQNIDLEFEIKKEFDKNKDIDYVKVKYLKGKR